MTIEQIIKALERIEGELVGISESQPFKDISSHEEFSCDDATLVDSIQGVRQTLEAIGYVLDFDDKNGQV